MTDLNYIESKVKAYCKDNNDINMIISSERYYGGPCCLGIDEAGRGPVLGPMVYAGAYTELHRLSKLDNIGLDDSKKLKESVRDDLLEKLSNYGNKVCGYEVEIISPNVISNQMLSATKTSLNVISHNAAIDIIKRVIDKGINLQEVYIDTVGPPDKYRSMIEGLFPSVAVVRVECKADSKFPIVSAASIFAKVIRDKCIRNWQHRESSIPLLDCGSGYPSDPVTKEYLKHIVDPFFGFPQFVRASWSTASVIMERECLAVEYQDNNNENNDDVVKNKKSGGGSKRTSGGVVPEKDNQSLLNFYSPDLAVDKRHKFFTSRKLERVVTFD